MTQAQGTLLVAPAPLAERGRLSFRMVNRAGAADHDPGLQRHHLLPRQLLAARCFGTMFDGIGRERVRFDDFRSNGLLLPANDAAALRLGLPLHRGPHHRYNAMVIERVGQIEAEWARMKLTAPDVALRDALMRLALLQRALRRRLLDVRGAPLALNRHDPRGRPVDFSELDAMADSLWHDAGAAMQPLFAQWTDKPPVIPAQAGTHLPHMPVQQPLQEYEASGDGFPPARE